MELRKISRSEYLQIPYRSRLIDADEFTHSYAAIHLTGVDEIFGVCWHSTTIDPSIVEVGDILWFGIDQNIVALDQRHGRLRFALHLATPLLSITRVARGVVLLSQVEAIIINDDFSIHALLDFPDIADKFTVTSSGAVVELLDGRQLEFELMW